MKKFCASRIIIIGILFIVMFLGLSTSFGDNKIIGEQPVVPFEICLKNVTNCPIIFKIQNKLYRVNYNDHMLISVTPDTSGKDEVQVDIESYITKDGKRVDIDEKVIAKDGQIVLTSGAVDAIGFTVDVLDKKYVSESHCWTQL